MAVIALLVPLAYLLGTFPSATLVGRVGGHDVLHEGSGNPGASNVIRLLGWRAGLLVLGADFGKGALSAGAGLAIEGRAGAYVLGVAALAGHVFPVTRRFKGGKGVAVAGGTLVVLFPWIVLGFGVCWFVLARVTGKASVASLVGTLLFPVAVALSGYGWVDVAVVSGLAVAVVARHASNLRRLVRGEELSLRPEHPPAGADGGPPTAQR